MTWDHAGPTPHDRALKRLGWEPKTGDAVWVWHVVQGNFELRTVRKWMRGVYVNLRRPSALMGFTDHWVQLLPHINDDVLRDAYVGPSEIWPRSTA